MKRTACLLLCLALCCALFACGKTESPNATTTETISQPAADDSGIEATEQPGYFDMVWGWACPPGEYASYIDAIYHTESGTAGSSGKAALSAAQLLALSNAYSDDGSTAMAAVFASMNDAQARFFASQWIRFRLLAEEAIDDPAQFRESYGWAGLEDFDPSPYSTQALHRLDGIVATLLCREEMR